MFVFTLASVAYAETVEVPFDASEFDPLTEDCFPMGGDFFCKWNPYKDVKTTPVDNSGDPVPESKTLIGPKECPDRFTISEDGKRCMPNDRTVVIEDPVQRKIMKTIEEAIKRFEENPPTRPSEREEYALYKELASCTRGTGSATGIQQDDRFLVSTTWINPAIEYLVALDIRGNHAVLKKAIAECQAQHTVLEPVILGTQYMNRVIAEENNPWVEHSKRPYVLAIEEQPAVNLNARDYIESLEDAQKILCRHALYSEQTKRDYGCFEDNSVNVGGVTSTFNSPIHKFNEYMDMSWDVNTSVIVKSLGASDVGNFISQQGGYEEAINAIKWQQHFETTNAVEGEKAWDE